jgi:hypothetical protein
LNVFLTLSLDHFSKRVASRDHAVITEEKKMTPAPIVFFDIAGPDNAAQSAFYAKVFGWEIGAGD